MKHNTKLNKRLPIHMSDLPVDVRKQIRVLGAECRKLASGKKFSLGGIKAFMVWRSDDSAELEIEPFSLSFGNKQSFKEIFAIRNIRLCIS